MNSSIFRLAVFATGLALAGCAVPVAEQAQRLSAAGRHEQAHRLLTDALQQSPQDAALRAADVMEREALLEDLGRRIDEERASGRPDAARQLLQQARALDAQHPRVARAAAELERDERTEMLLAQARTQEASGHLPQALALVDKALLEEPRNAAARALQVKLREKASIEPAPVQLGAAFQRSVTLEFRDAPLRTVLETLARNNGVNFVFDKDVKGDARVSVFLRDVSIDDALKVILSTQQLDRKLLNESTVLVYPATAAKQREHQELVSRSFFLNSADVKQAQALVRTIAKSRDMFVDERLNLLIVRDTPEVMRLVERLIASIDIADPEVVLDVEVMEVARSRLDELGLRWPDQIDYGVIGGAATVAVGDHGAFRASIANPALSARLRESTTRSNVLANPRLRARNREKAKVLIGEKLPVFTTTSTANVGVSASVNYLDVGLKLEVEPAVQLDGDVIMHVNLEVSTLIGRVLGPQGSVAYQVGTRQATTSLKLRDGETQVLAGLIRDEDTKGVEGLPGLAGLPVLGRLFGVHTDQRQKTEIVLLITPRVVRHLDLPDAVNTRMPAGVDTSPGAEPLRIKSRSRLALAPGMGAVTAGPARGAAGEAGAPGVAVVELATSGHVEAGGTVAVTLRNRSGVALKGELEYDALLLKPAQAASERGSRLTFSLPAGGDSVLMLRALPAAEGKSTTLNLVNVGTSEGDASLMVQIQGDGVVAVGTR